MNVILPDTSKLKDYEYPAIAERFYRETAYHELTVLQDNGPYRHLRMMPDRSRSSSYWYEVVTWPGNLVFRGDGESFVFSIFGKDMFSLFREGLWKDGSIHINATYWAEKLSSDRECVKAYQSEEFEKLVRAEMERAIKEDRIPQKHVERFRQEIKDKIFENFDFSTECEEESYRAVEGFEFYFDEADEFRYGKNADWRFYEPYEWFGQTKDYEWWFLWSLYGVVKAIKAYDQHKGTGMAMDVAAAGSVVLV